MTPIGRPPLIEGFPTDGVPCGLDTQPLMWGFLPDGLPYGADTRRYREDSQRPGHHTDWIATATG